MSVTSTVTYTVARHTSPSRGVSSSVSPPPILTPTTLVKSGAYPSSMSASTSVAIHLSGACVVVLLIEYHATDARASSSVRSHSCAADTEPSSAALALKRSCAAPPERGRSSPFAWLTYSG